MIKSFRCSSQQCVTFHFLNCPPLEVFQNDLRARNCAKDRKPLFKSGKSCLLAIPESQIYQQHPIIVVDVAVNKRLPPECLSGQASVGKTSIKLPDLFNGIVQLANLERCLRS
jgi:hypothetical protein